MKIVWLMMLLLLVEANAAFAAAADIDLRIVLDNSANMAAQDSDDLRSSGAALLIQGLPDGARAGVWSYAQHTRQIAPYERVSGLWKQVAAIHVENLPEGNQQANLPHALRAATWDLDSVQRADVHLVVFSTGAIDTGEGPDVATGARIELLSEWATGLRAGRITVHTIAPADMGDAPQDLALLKQISHLSGGLHVQVSDLESLQKALLKIRDLASAASEVQIDGEGRFQIPPGTERFTILWFAQADGPAPLGLRTPGGARLGRLASLPGGRWLLADSFEIVTIEAPEPGWWQIDGPKPARLSVYGDLDVRVIGLDNPVVPADETLARVEIYSRGQRISNPDFLNLLQVKAWLEDERDRQLVPVELSSDGYDVRFVRLRDGLQELDLRVIAPTFSKRVRVPFVVSNPLQVDVRSSPQGEPVAWVQFAHAAVDYGGLRVAARVRKPPGIATLIPGEPMPGGMWRIPLLGSGSGAAAGYDGIIEAAFSIAGNYMDGKGFFLKTSPQAVALPLQENEAITLRFNADGKLLETPEPLPAGGDWEPIEELAVQESSGATGDAGSAAQTVMVSQPQVAQLPLWLVGVLSLTSLLFGAVVWWLYKPGALLLEPTVESAEPA